MPETSPVTGPEENNTPVFVPPGTCRSCGAPTAVISRRIGFFGLTETWCTHCRDCLPAAATEQGYDPDELLTEHDDAVAAVADAKKAYAERQEKRGGNSSRYDERA